MIIRQKENSVVSNHSKRNKKRELKGKTYISHFGRFSLKREKLLSRNTLDPTVDGLWDKKENCSTLRGLRVGTEFRELPQTPRGRDFSLLEFYSHFKCFTNV